MRTRIQEKETVIKITSVGGTGFSNAYVGNFFVVDSFDEEGKPLTFVDWLQQAPTKAHIKSLASLGYVLIAKNAWSITRKKECITTTTEEYVREKLISRFLIFKGELSHYPGEYDTMINVGAESYFQKRKFEMDFLIRDIIINTPFVTSIVIFESSVDKEMRYSAKFRVNLTDGSELVWQIEI